MTKKLNRISQKIKSAEILYSNGQVIDGMIMYWQASRDYIFYYLHEQRIPFHSTNEALREIQKIVDPQIGMKIIQSEITSTLCEWDEFLEITNSQADDFKKNCLAIISNLGYGKQRL